MRLRPAGPCASAELTTLLRLWLAQARKNRKLPLFGPGLAASSLKNSVSTEKLVCNFGNDSASSCVEGPSWLTTGRIWRANGRISFLITGVVSFASLRVASWAGFRDEANG